METLKQGIEHEPTPKDISAEFLNMAWYDFNDFLKTQLQEPALSITIDWVDLPTAKMLKNFLDTRRGQIRTATIRATQEQYDQDVNAFESGVKWERV